LKNKPENSETKTTPERAKKKKKKNPDKKGGLKATNPKVKTPHSTSRAKELKREQGEQASENCSLPSKKERKPPRLAKAVKQKKGNEISKKPKKSCEKTGHRKTKNIQRTLKKKQLGVAPRRRTYKTASPDPPEERGNSARRNGEAKGSAKEAGRRSGFDGWI